MRFPCIVCLCQYFQIYALMKKDIKTLRNGNFYRKILFFDLFCCVALLQVSFKILEISCHVRLKKI